MIFGIIEASWTFVQSPTYTGVSIVVGLIVTIFLAALVIQQELLQIPGAPNNSTRRLRARTPAVLCEEDLPRRPYGGVAVPPLVLCFVIIVIVRLATLAYQRPKTTSSDPTTPTAQPTAAPTRPAGGARSSVLPAVGVSRVSEHTYSKMHYPKTRAIDIPASAPHRVVALRAMDSRDFVAPQVIFAADYTI